MLVQIFSHKQVQEAILIPSVPEPLIVWVLSGTAVVEERELNGPWQANLVTAGDFFLTTSPKPYELRWKAKGPQQFQVMHLYLGLPIFNRALKDVFNQTGTKSVSLEATEILFADGSKVTLRLSPLASWFMPRVLELAEEGVGPGGLSRNRDFYGPRVDDQDAPEAMRRALYDPQTSGGLLLAVPARRVASLAAALKRRRVWVAEVGEVRARVRKSVELTTG